MFSKSLAWFDQSMSPCSNITKKPSGSSPSTSSVACTASGKRGVLLAALRDRRRSRRVGRHVVLEIAARAAEQAEQLVTGGDVHAGRRGQQRVAAVVPACRPTYVYAVAPFSSAVWSAADK